MYAKSVLGFQKLIFSPVVKFVPQFWLSGQLYRDYTGIKTQHMGISQQQLEMLLTRKSHKETTP